jgi:hypothetical protein
MAGDGFVAQISNLPYRRLPVGGSVQARGGGGLEIRDTTGWKPALLWLRLHYAKVWRTAARTAAVGLVLVLGCAAVAWAQQVCLTPTVLDSHPTVAEFRDELARADLVLRGKITKIIHRRDGNLGELTALLQPTRLYKGAFDLEPPLVWRDHSVLLRTTRILDYQAWPIPVGQKIHLTARYFSRQVEGWIDSQKVLARVIPADHPGAKNGRIGLWTFETWAEFDNVKVTRLVPVEEK